MSFLARAPAFFPGLVASVRNDHLAPGCPVGSSRRFSPTRRTPQSLYRRGHASHVHQLPFSTLFPPVALALLLIPTSSVLQRTRFPHPSQSKISPVMNQNAPKPPPLPLPSLVVPKMQLTEQTMLVRCSILHHNRLLHFRRPEFAFEIGSGLLTEVRRLQSLLGERDKAIQDMKEEKDDLEKSIESLRTALRSQEQSSGAISITSALPISHPELDQTSSRKRTGISRSPSRSSAPSYPIPKALHRGWNPSTNGSPSCLTQHANPRTSTRTKQNAQRLRLTNSKPNMTPNSLRHGSTPLVCNATNLICSRLLTL